MPGKCSRHVWKASGHVAGNIQDMTRHILGNLREEKQDMSVYAQTLILVNLILVNFFGFLVIARNPPERF